MVTARSLGAGPAGTGSGGVEDPGCDQREDQQAEHDPVDDERREAAAVEVAQQPGDRRSGRRRSAMTVARIVGPQDDALARDVAGQRLVGLEEPRAEDGGDGEQERVARRGRPRVAEEQPIVIVPPERETPGISAIAWANPKAMPCADGELGAARASWRPTRSAQKQDQREQRPGGRRRSAGRAASSRCRPGTAGRGRRSGCCRR